MRLKKSPARGPFSLNAGTTRVVCKPERCAKCAAQLRGDDGDPLRHQVFELPRVEPLVHEYELHALTCSCGHVTRAGLPPGVPSRAFGPSVDATVATLLTVYRLSRRMVPDFLQDFFGLTMADGSVVKCQQAVSQAIAQPVEDAHVAAMAAGVKYADETGWREARGRAFLWTVVTATITVFLIRKRSPPRLLTRAEWQRDPQPGSSDGACRPWSAASQALAT
jgi:transposase